MMLKEYMPRHLHFGECVTNIFNTSKQIVVGERMVYKVLITGGSRGIGRAIYELYSEKGYDVIAPGRKEMNLGNIDSVKEFVEKNREFDIVINNAGNNDIMNIDKLNEESTMSMIMTNLVSPIILMGGLVPHMKSRGFGRIVNIGSIWGTVSKSGRAVYSATKSGIHGVTKTLAVELAPWNILVNTISPGYTLTDLTVKNNSEEELNTIRTNIPLGRLAETCEIAKAVFFVGNEDNTYITGQDILVDGGFSIQ